MKELTFKKRVLITGASGFIGSFLVEEALKQGYDVFAGVRKTSSRQFLQHTDLHFFELDFSSKTALTSQLTEFKSRQGGFDFVIHNAGLTQAKQREDFYRVNYDYTKNLVESIQASGMLPEKFVLISSLASYGPGNENRRDPIRVSDECRPISEYGKSKLKATQYITTHSQLPHLVIHPTGVYGPRDRGFYQFIKLVSKGIEPYIGAHKQALSFIYVKDLAKAVIALLPSSYVNCSYLISDGNGYEKEQIGIEAKRLLNRKTIRIKLPLRLMQIAVSGMDRLHMLLFNRLPFINREKLDEISSANWLCNSDEVWDHINDKPRYDLKRGVEETIDWYRENKWL